MLEKVAGMTVVAKDGRHRMKLAVASRQSVCVRCRSVVNPGALFAHDQNWHVYCLSCVETPEEQTQRRLAEWTGKKAV